MLVNSPCLLEVNYFETALKVTLLTETKDIPNLSDPSDLPVRLDTVEIEPCTYYILEVFAALLLISENNFLTPVHVPCFFFLTCI